MKIVTNIQDGFQNMPKLYGSQVREPGKVTDFQSGLKEAGKVSFTMIRLSIVTDLRRDLYTAITTELRDLCVSPSKARRKMVLLAQLKGLLEAVSLP